MRTYLCTTVYYYMLLTINSGTKVPTWSLHSWLTVAHVEISTTGSIYLLTDCTGQGP